MPEQSTSQLRQQLEGKLLQAVERAHAEYAINPTDSAREAFIEALQRFNRLVLDNQVPNDT